MPKATGIKAAKLTAGTVEAVPIRAAPIIKTADLFCVVFISGKFKRSNNSKGVPLRRNYKTGAVLLSVSFGLVHSAGALFGF